MSGVTVVTGARLHFGLICSSPDYEWHFGGIGMMLRHPAWQIVMRPLAEGADQVQASEEGTARVREFLAAIRMHLPLEAVTVAVTTEVPFHTGLGGGTQLALALAAAAKLLAGLKPAGDPHELAQLAQRAERSAVGTVGFRDGGFLIDHGVSTDPQRSRHVERIAIPEEWRFVLVRPDAIQGLHGDREKSFFSRRVQMPEPLVRSLTDEILQELAPSLRNRDHAAFARSLERYGDRVGSFYAAEQGDIFAHPDIRKLVTRLRGQGVVGAAQSSWGPGICIPAATATQALEIADLIENADSGTRMSVTIAEPLNSGACIRTIAPEVGRHRLA